MLSEIWDGFAEALELRHGQLSVRIGVEIREDLLRWTCWLRRLGGSGLRFCGWLRRACGSLLFAQLVKLPKVV